MKKCFFVALAAIAMASCSQIEDFSKKNSQTTANDFDFSTTKATQLNVNYGNMGCKASVYFEIYDQNPVNFNESDVTYQKKEGLTPLYSGYTKTDGTLSTSVSLPAYLSTVYVYSPSFFAQRVIEGTVENGVLNIHDTARSSQASAAPASRAASRATAATVTTDGWKTFLGTYDATSGKVNYAYDNSGKLAFTEEERGALLSTVTSLTESTKSSKYPEGYISSEYVSEADINLTKDSEIAITFLAGNTCWTSSLGYYYYQGNAPASYDEIKDRVILLLPNTIDGMWEKWDKYPNSCTSDKIGVDRGTTVQLKYYGPNVDQEGVAKFPAGTHIGFVLATESWSNKLGVHNANNKANIRSSTAIATSLNATKNKPAEARTCVFRKTVSENCSSVIVCFEDDGYNTTDSPNSANYTDVVIATKTNPLDAFDKKEVETVESESETIGGVYSFEDMWPYSADYDMNDAMVIYSHVSKKLAVHTKTTITTGSSTTTTTNTFGPYLDKEVLKFSTQHNFATKANNWAFRITDIPAGADLSKAKVTATCNGHTFTLVNRDNIYYMGAVNSDSYEINIDWSEATIDPNEMSKIECFAYRPEADGSYWEVHIPYEAPTSLMNIGYFAQGQDRTNVNANPVNWFTGKDDFPFAFFLNGATAADVAPLIQSENESKRIDVLYPNFKEWSQSRGAKATDWYKK